MEKKLLDDNEIGLDEAGRGPLIGRVYAGAVIWGDKDCDLINDSKKLSQKKRKIALEWIKNNVVAFGVGFIDASEIDEINILEATKKAMDNAIIDLKDKLNNNFIIKNLIIDGIGWEKKFNNYNVKSIIKGDSKYYSIAAASIIAKEYHDDYIIDLCEKYPDLVNKYDLLNNKGYGTKKHLEGIEKYGISQFHRKSFKRCY